MEISTERRAEIRSIADFIREKKIKNLLFVCTHNSRRSQFCQIAFAAAGQGLGFGSYSAGTEVTTVYKTVIKTLQTIGFEIKVSGPETNPKYFIVQDDETVLTSLQSKTYTDTSIPQENTLALINCDDAEQNCPFIPFAAGRMPLRYEDPKHSDGSTGEEQIYADKFAEIYMEMKLLVDFIA